MNMAKLYLVLFLKHMTGTIRRMNQAGETIEIVLVLHTYG